jgi:CTP:molybdopterin cytidylyltransferase MocA
MIGEKDCGRKRYVKVAAVVFEGGPEPANELAEVMQGLRHSVCLDTLVKLRQVPGIAEVWLVSNKERLCATAERLGARVYDTRGSFFHFGRTLQAVCRATGAAGILYMGGAALPLISPEQLAWVVQQVQTPGRVVVNNPQSVDLVAFSPVSALDRIVLPEQDNFLGVLLREAGLERVMIPNSASVNFDLDTPTDYLMLSLCPGAGPRTRTALAALEWPLDRVRAAALLLQSETLPEVALIGRVGPAVVEYMNQSLRVRLRIFSEERGMKALGRESAGLVVSFLARLLEDVGPERFFAHLASICQAAFIDTRVFFAHGGRRVSDWDRYHSDLGVPEAIHDPWVRRFTAAALGAGIPVLLGGHSTVAGGLWALAENAVAVLEQRNLTR